MRCLSILVLALVAIASATPTHIDYKYADKTYLERQKFLLEIMQHVMQPTFFPEIEKMAEEFKFENYWDKFADVELVKDCYRSYQVEHMQKGLVFSVFYDAHREEAMYLFYVLYNAKDWDTFAHVAAWARKHMNEGVFVYAMTIAVLHREDTKGMYIPPPYEIYPYMFANAEVLQKAYRIRMQKGLLDPKLAKYFGVEEVDEKTYTIYANYSGWYSSYGHEDKLSYFTEDIALNSFYYYFHADYPFWLGGEEYGLKKDKRGEIFYYVHQQLLARYYLERLSNGMGEIKAFSWKEPIATGYYPTMMYHNFMSFPNREHEYEVDTSEYLQYVEVYEKMFRDIAIFGYYTKDDGSRVYLSKAEDFDTYGLILENNEDSPYNRMNKYWFIIARYLLSPQPEFSDKYYSLPSSLQHFETSMRDPMFWQLYKRMTQYFYMYKNLLPSYTKEQLHFPGVKVVDVTTDKLVTYFEYFDYEITDAVYLSKEEMEAQKEDFIFNARQLQLNHEDFEMKFTIESDKEVDCVVNLFLGPKYDEFGHLIDINENRHNFFNIDHFRYKLKTGQNIVTRRSDDFDFTTDDFTPSREVYRQVEVALNGGEQFKLHANETHSGFPHRLILPKGKKGGMPFILYVFVYPYQKPALEYGSNYDENISTGVGSGARLLDNAPWGYPLDRKIDEYNFYTPNMYFKDVIIFHKSKYSVTRSPHYYQEQELH